MKTQVERIEQMSTLTINRLGSQRIVVSWLTSSTHQALSAGSSVQRDRRHDMDELLRTFSSGASALIEGAAVLVVAAASFEAFVRLLAAVARRGVTHGQRKAIWHRYGIWLLLGLEFELAPDIIRSVVFPTWQDLGELAAIALIRTFLNYFLEKDLETTSRDSGPITSAP